MANGNLKRIFPNVVKQGIVSRVYEDVDYKKTIGKKTNLGRRGVEVMYQLTLDKITADSTVGNATLWRNDIPENNGVLGQYSVPYYKIQSKFSTDVDSRAKFDELGAGISEVEFKEKITLQAINQRIAYSTFMGFENKQGLFNQAGLTTPLPQDTNHTETLTGYIPGELLEFLVGQLRDMMTISYNSLKPIVIVAPQDAINFLKTKIVPLTDYQFKGAGTGAISNVMNEVVYELNGLKVEFVECSYMKGIGTGSKDVMLFIAPGMERFDADRDSTALMNTVSPEDTVNTFRDFALELEVFQNPTINQKDEKVYTTICTPAYTVRQDAIRVVEYQYK